MSIKEKMLSLETYCVYCNTLINKLSATYSSLPLLKNNIVFPSILNSNYNKLDLPIPCWSDY